MSLNTPTFNNSGHIQGNINQYSISGPYSDNRCTDSRDTHHHHNAPVYNYSTNANGAPVVNGAFNGVQYNISPPPQSQRSEIPYFPMNPQQFTQDPEAMEDSPPGRGVPQVNQGYQPRSRSGDSESDIFELYNQPPNTQWGPADNRYPGSHPTRPGPAPNQNPSRSYTTPMPQGHAAPSYNPYPPHQWSDPVVPRYPHYSSPPNTGANVYSAGHPDPRAQPRVFTANNGFNRPQDARPSRRETNPFVRMIEDEKRNTEKPQGYFQ